MNIYTSRLYRSSKHQSRINAAIQNPLNVELVQQLKEYITPEESTDDSKSAAPIQHNVADTAVEPDPLIDTVEPQDDLDANIDDSTGSVEPTVIQSSVTIAPTATLALDSVQGLLNATESTAGVTIVVQRSSESSLAELCIYYQSRINLNTVMGEVIELLSSAGYDNLSFNRLVRNDNAIVFDIISTSTPTSGA